MRRVLRRGVRAAQEAASFRKQMLEAMVAIHKAGVEHGGRDGSLYTAKDDKVYITGFSGGKEGGRNTRMQGARARVSPTRHDRASHVRRALRY